LTDFSDIVVASPTALFGLPEAARGLAANAGGLPRLVRLCGIQIASEVALAGRRLSADEALRLNLINKVSVTQDSVVQEAVELAQRVAEHSPDAIIVSRSAIREAWQQASVEQANRVTQDRFAKALYKGENAHIGLDAFAQKKKLKWRASSL
jgi:enoyl-CoA hydratase/carnithine racemase